MIFDVNLIESYISHAYFIHLWRCDFCGDDIICR